LSKNESYSEISKSNIENGRTDSISAKDIEWG